ncbi:MAG: RNA-binding protein [Ruminococcaceae bacterium]|nr:RNA-binding protein [Oscillospiraceae bacterium]
MEEKFSMGDIVLSKAGRDSGRYFVVVAVDGIFVYICDGDLHKIDKPKKKKIKHVKPTEGKSEYVAAKLVEESKVTNTELRRAISEFEEQALLMKNE